MPQYPFRTGSGAVVYVTIPMKEAPCIGAEVVLGGERLTRLPPQPGDLKVNGDPFSGRYPYVSHQLPLKLKGETHDKDGFTVVRNAREQDRIAKTYGATVV